MFTRKVDDLGRIVLPKEIRKNFTIREQDMLIITTKGKKIILEKDIEKIRCKKCKKTIDKKDSFCKYCGEEIK